MQLIRRLLFRNRSQSGRNHKIRGLSTAELVGIIVIVGVLGALGGTYVTGLVTTAKNNTGDQNAQNLNTVMTSALAAGAAIATGGAQNTVDLTDTASAWTALVTNGVTVKDSAGNVSTYQVNPAPGTAASYVFTPGNPQTVATPGSWAFTHGSSP